MQPGTNTA